VKYLIALSLVVFLSQVQDVVGQITTGNYSKVYDLSNSLIKYDLTLNEDGSFYFHFYRKNICDNCVEENQCGRGSWQVVENDLILTTDPELDLDEKCTLNLNGSKGRLVKKRDSEGLRHEVLKFYASDLFWVKGLELNN